MIGELVKSEQTTVSSFDRNRPNKTLLQEFLDITIPVNDKPSSHNIKNHIVTTGSHVFEPARRITGEGLQAARDEFNYMLDEGYLPAA